MSDRTTLFEAWRNASRERARREEARRREREEREEREETERRERAAQREREALERATGRLAVLEAEFESLRKRASEMRKSLTGAGIELPAEPSLPEVNRNDTGAILACLSGIESTIAAYRSGLNDAMLRYSRDRAAEMGRDEVLDWYGSFVATPPGTAIGFSNNEALAGREAQTSELRCRAFERAREMMAKVERKVVHVSEGLRGAIEAVLSAPSLADMRLAEARLECMVRQEIARADEEEARRHEELERLQTDRVAAVMAESLAEMGYVVSNVYESAYTRDGQIFACRRDHPGTEHAVRLTIDRETRQVTSNVVRIVDSDDPPARTGEQQAQDREADSEWCDQSGIIRFEEKLKERGVDVEFAPNGSSQVGAVSAAAVATASPTLEAHLLRAARRPAAVRQQPRTRSRSVP